MKQIQNTEIPVNFTKEELVEFNQLFLKHFGIILSEKETYDHATRLFNAIKASVKPIPESDTLNNK